jgi:hypothetical protein
VVDAGEWYRAPVDRFIACMARRLADSETEMTLDEAFDLALQDKKYEEEARRIEFRVQKEQAEVCVRFIQWSILLNCVFRFSRFRFVFLLSFFSFLFLFLFFSVH